MSDTTTQLHPSPASATDRYPSRQAAEPRITNRLDPVVYGQAETGPLDASQLRFFEDNGYLSMDQVFSEAELTACFRSHEMLLALVRMRPAACAASFDQPRRAGVQR